MYKLTCKPTSALIRLPLVWVSSTNLLYIAFLIWVVLAPLSFLLNNHRLRTILCKKKDIRQITAFLLWHKAFYTAIKRLWYKTNPWEFCVFKPRLFSFKTKIHWDWSKIWMYIVNIPMHSCGRKLTYTLGAFKNYVDHFLPSFDHLPTYGWHVY